MSGQVGRLARISRKNPFQSDFLPVVTITICLWSAVVFLGVNLQSNRGWEALSRWGWIPEHSIYQGSVWGLVTDAFVHMEPLHLLFNLYWVWIIGGAFERTLGSLRLLLFVLVAAFVSSGIQLFDGPGIGLSGVGYALFGFAWVGRHRYPEFARVINDRTVRMFIGWGILCVVATYMHVMNIGNIAHASGLMFGAALAGLMLMPQWRLALAAAVVAMASLATASVFWNPRSIEWLLTQADKAEAKRDYTRAEDLLRQVLRLASDDSVTSWTWHMLAEDYGYQRKLPEYKEAVHELQNYDPAAAKQVIEDYGNPDK